jgi:hypothetical protein
MPGLLRGVARTAAVAGTASAVSNRVSRRQGRRWAAQLLLLASPAILVLLLGRRAQVLLPKVRDWMNTNSWIVSELVILLFVGITINSLAS